jgi:hypothetical protein
MPEAMKPSSELIEIFLRCALSYTSVLWKSIVSAAFYADFRAQRCKKTRKIAFQRVPPFQNGPFGR